MGANSLPYEIWYLEKLDLTKLDLRKAEMVDGKVQYGTLTELVPKAPVKAEISASIAKFGQIEPVIVWGHEIGAVRIMVGHQRATACAQAGDPFVTALVSIRPGDMPLVYKLAAPVSCFEQVDPLTPERLRSYFRKEPSVINLNRRGWGVTPADIKEYR